MIRDRCFLAIILLLLLVPAYANDGLDLPIERPLYREPVETPPDKEAPLPPPPVPAPEPPPEPQDVPPPVFFGEVIPIEKDSIVYVVDRSSSMLTVTRTNAPNRWERAQQETINSIEGLSPQIRFNVWTYNCATSGLWETSQPATPTAKAEAIAWILGQEPNYGGTDGTGTGYAVTAALQDRSNVSMVLLTDGQPGCRGEVYAGKGPNQIHLELILTNNLQGARIDVFALDPPDQIAERFCREVASATGGAYYEFKN